MDNLPKEIDKLEAQLEELTEIMSDAKFYQEDAHKVKQTTQKNQKIATILAEKYKRWDELENF